MIVLITGSSGFIGFHLSNFFLKRGYKVIGLDNHNGYYSKRIKNKRLLFLKKNKNFNFFKTNIANPVKLEKIFYNYNPDVVYHLSGQPGVLYSLKNPKIYKINNFIATKNICKLCKKYEIKNFFFASSSSIYGDQKIFPIKESSKPFPKNPYARTKLNSEKVIQKIFKKSKIRYLIFRFFTVYGPLGRPDMFIHKFLKGIEKNKTISLFNNGLNFRDFTYIDDVVKILFLFLKKNTDKKIINICRSKTIRTIELVNILKKSCNKKNIKIKMTGFVKGEMLKTHGSNKKLKKYIGNIKFTNLEKGINKTVKAYNLFGI